MTRDVFDDTFAKHFGSPAATPPTNNEHEYRQYHGKEGGLEHFTYLARKMHHHVKGWHDAMNAGDESAEKIHNNGEMEANRDMNHHFWDHLPNDDAWEDLDKHIQNAKGGHLSTQDIHDVWHHHSIEDHLP